MAKQSKEQKLMHKWWVRGVLAIVLLGIAYGFASLAIDNGSLFTYALSIVFIAWACIQIKQGIHYLRAK